MSGLIRKFWQWWTGESASTGTWTVEVDFIREGVGFTAFEGETFSEYEAGEIAQDLAQAFLAKGRLVLVSITPF